MRDVPDTGKCRTEQCAGAGSHPAEQADASKKRFLATMSRTRTRFNASLVIIRMIVQEDV